MDAVLRVVIEIIDQHILQGMAANLPILVLHILDLKKYLKDRHYHGKREQCQECRKDIEKYIEYEIFPVRRHKPPEQAPEFFHIP